jgi:hypothetical protein
MMLNILHFNFSSLVTDNIWTNSNSQSIKLLTCSIFLPNEDIIYWEASKNVKGLKLNGIHKLLVYCGDATG